MKGIVYKDDRYTLGEDKNCAYLIACGKRYALTCHPFEPCLYITGDDGVSSVVRNAFDPSFVLDAFRDGRTVCSVTGMEYDAKDFCEMVEYASRMGDAAIDDAEQVFAGRLQRVSRRISCSGSRRLKGSLKDLKSAQQSVSIELCTMPDDPAYDLISRYPDAAVDYCIVKDEKPYYGYESHIRALAAACRKVFYDGEAERLWDYDVSAAQGHPISAYDFLSSGGGSLRYRTAFLHPPHENSYNDADFDRINAALFPNGTDGAEIFEWSTDWSDYFDDGHEWWGTLCLTVYDKSLERFVVILASATD